MARNNIRNHATFCDTSPLTPEIRPTRRFRTEIRDRTVWPRHALENLGAAIEQEIARRERAAEVPPEKPTQKAEQSEPLSFEEALRKEAEAFQKRYRSGVMNGR